MGNVMVVLDDEHERKLRRMAQQKYGSKKGSLSKVVWEALDEMEAKGKTATEELEEMFNTAKPVRYKMYKNRSELYE
ncbi:MAG: hypothetical protein V1822_00415 [Candidatus Micrarchaeota archaeon]